MAAVSPLKYGTGLGNSHTPGWGQYGSISLLSFSLTLAWVLQAADVLTPGFSAKISLGCPFPAITEKGFREDSLIGALAVLFVLLTRT